MTGLDEVMASIQHDAPDPVRVAALTDLDPATLYEILRLRVDVFVVEQNCAYPELDERDVEPGARQLWVERAGAVAATLRLLADADGTARIGRVATRAHLRGSGLAAMLMREAIALTGERDIVLNAQVYLEQWYRRFGFVRDGENYDEDGIPHVPMRRTHTLPA